MSISGIVASLFACILTMKNFILGVFDPCAVLYKVAKRIGQSKSRQAITVIGRVLFYVYIVRYCGYGSLKSALL